MKVIMQDIIVSVKQFVIDNITDTIRRMRLRKIIDGHNIKSFLASQDH